MKGKNNEDRFGVASFRSKALPNTPILLAVLSDGIGGNRAGEVASELTVNLISQFAAESDGRSPQTILEGAIHFASGQIFQQAQQNAEQLGMGATCACAWIAGDRLFTATVGDSRIYLMRGERIQQISIDHTWIQEALENGFIQPNEVNGHPNAHVIRRYLGSPTPPEVDFRMRSETVEEAQDPAVRGLAMGLRLLPDDRLLLCTDGLTDLVPDEEILAAFQQKTLEEAGYFLIDLANQRGGHDNITLISIQVPGGPVKPLPVAAAPAARGFRSRVRSLLVGCLLVSAVAALAGGLFGGYLLYSNNATPTPTFPAGVTPATATRTPLPLRTMRVTPSPVRLLPSTTPTTLPRPAGTVRTPTAWPTNTSALPIVPTRAQ
jgi:protein phosphatase